MRRTQTTSIAQIISEVIDEYGMGDKMREKRIIAAWSEVLGPLSKPDDKLYIRNRILFAKLASSVVRNELSMMRTTLMRRLNERAGAEVITDIVFQ